MDIIVERLVSSLTPEGIEYLKQALGLPIGWNSIMVSAWLGPNNNIGLAWNNNQACLQFVPNHNHNNHNNDNIRMFPLPLDAFQDESLHEIYNRIQPNHNIPDTIGSPEWRAYFREAFRPFNRNTPRDRIIIQIIPN